MKVAKGIIFFALIIIFLFTGNNSWAFRCGSGLVSSGDTKTQVSVTCGKPTSKEKKCKNNQEYTTTAKSGRLKKIKKCGNKVEVWHYNCGEKRGKVHDRFAGTERLRRSRTSLS